MFPYIYYTITTCLMNNKLVREITPLTQHDCFTIFSRVKKAFDFPLHYHEEFELNLILHGKGSRRIVGDHVGEIDDVELVLIGPNLAHAWFTHRCTSNEIKEVTIQFHKDLFDEKFLRRNQLHFIKRLFELAGRGILFPKETIMAIAPRIESMHQKSGFDSVLSLINILHDLSVSRNLRTLSESTFNTEVQVSFYSRRIEKAFEFMNNNYDKQITLADMAKLVNMTEVSFSRFMKKRTGIGFIDSLNEIRLGHACRILIETTNSVTEISYMCGFNNISNFNRLFKKKKGCTPKEFRENFSGVRTFI